MPLQSAPGCRFPLAWRGRRPTLPLVELTFEPLRSAPVGQLRDLLNDSRIARHLPLKTRDFSTEATLEWMRAKQAQWVAHGYGPWAIRAGGAFAGWGGFQREKHGPDFVLVLRPEHWGIGTRAFHAAAAEGFTKLGFDAIFISLPPSRVSFRAVRRLGFEASGEVQHGGVRFLCFRLSRARFRAARGGPRAGESAAAG